MSETKYHKIQTVFHRDPETNHRTLLDGVWSCPEFEYLSDSLWEATEKIDGTNIRIIFNPDGSIIFGGKTDKALIPAKLVTRLNERFINDCPLQRVFGANPDEVIILYCEGYGAGIQKGGIYRPDQDVILFDIKVGPWWLSRENVADIAGRLGLQQVNVVAKDTLENLIDMVADRRILDVTPFRDVMGFSTDKPEGIVMRPEVELCTRGGDRIITKLKFKDFPQDG